MSRNRWLKSCIDCQKSFCNLFSHGYMVSRLKFFAVICAGSQDNFIGPLFGGSHGGFNIIDPVGSGWQRPHPTVDTFCLSRKGNVFTDSVLFSTHDRKRCSINLWWVPIRTQKESSNQTNDACQHCQSAQ